MNPGSPEYKAGVLTTQSLRSVKRTDDNDGDDDDDNRRRKSKPKTKLCSGSLFYDAFSVKRLWA
jgi:hypothetical protein